MAGQCIFFVVDVSNVVRARSGGGTTRLSDLDQVDSEIQRRWPGAVVRRIADASLRHRIAESEPGEASRFEQMIRSQHVVQVPAGTRADDFVIKEATWFGGYMVTNDKFDKDERAIAPETVVPERMVKVYFAGDMVDLILAQEPVPLPGSERVPRPEGAIDQPSDEQGGPNETPWLAREMFEDPDNFSKLFNMFNMSIHDAVVEGEAEEVRQMLASESFKSEVDLGVRWEDRMTVLHLAAVLDHPEVVQILVDNGADLEATAVEGMTPLLVAAVNDRVAAVGRLLDAGAEIEAVDSEQGATALNFAAFYGQNELARLLVDRGANVNCVNRIGTPPIQTAVAQNNLAMVGMLLDAGARVDVCSGGLTLLFIASQDGHADMVRLIMQHGADPNARRPPEFDHFAPLHAAVHHEHQSVIHALAAGGADMNIRAAHGVTPLIMAAAERRSSVATELIRLGADPDIPDDEGWRPIKYAIRNNDGEMCRVLQNTPRGTAAKQVISESSVPAGWFEDPTGRHEHRYWDGAAWTHFVSDAGVQSQDSV
jgi:ankyrin repeat protein